MAQLAGSIAQSLMMLNANGGSSNNSRASRIDRPNAYEHDRHEIHESSDKTGSHHHGVVQQAYFERKAMLERAPSISQLVGMPSYDERSSIGIPDGKARMHCVRLPCQFLLRQQGIYL
jgi:hypothetical protein